ncbi:hypothetical protein CUMW_055640 [Citrus unshiu]|nr:hypothetical protein CUMW_055640 [Citrus unshiu]
MADLSPLNLCIIKYNLSGFSMTGGRQTRGLHRSAGPIFIRSRFHFWLPGVVKKQSRTASSVDMMLRLAFLLINLLNLAAPGLPLAADEYSKHDFPAGFIFGSGTSAYQVEGAANEDGRTPSIWDTFTHAGNVHDNGDIASDGYHKYKEDVKLMADTGLDAYRFSISWSRLIPNGRGPVNPTGLQYYNSLINELISHGIQPHVTLHHYDLPQALEDEYGGWINQTIVQDFTAYANVCFREFGDRVSYWTTVNEPNAFALLGYDIGIAPPKRCSPPFKNCCKGNSSTEPYMAVHHVLLAHASVARLIANPLVYGDYPYIMKKNVGSRLPLFTYLESKQVKGSADFLGVNNYNSGYIKDNPSSLKQELRDWNADTAAEIFLNLDTASANEFPIEPWGLQQVLEYFKKVYGNPPIYVHENGQVTPSSSSLEDVARVKYLQAYIGSMLDAVRNESNTRGYFTWSLLDMFELLGGYEWSYGLYYVDRDDPGLKRYPKLSAHWYSRFLKGRSVRSVNEAFKLEKNLSTLPYALTAVEYTKNDFPPGFLFGASTSAYQVEGAANEDGRTPSIWDTFAHAGNVHGTGDIACDGYHKYKEDVKLMADTGLDAYRFSISWSRLIPNGRGPVNPKGLQYYNNLINELISYGIQPHVTLHHFDLPQALEDEYGGWINRTIVKDFTAYADVCFRQFGDRVSYWTTVNEPNAFANLGYDYGISPPQRCSSINHCSRGNSSTEPYITVHHVLLAHASVARLYRKKYQDKQRGYIGVNIFAFGLLPLTNSTEDAIATQRYYDFLIGWMANPLVYGDYPKIMKQNVGSRLPAFSDRESKQFPIQPLGLQRVLEHFKQLYGNPPMYIHENGQNTPRRSSLKDISRVKYLHAYIGSVLDAVRNGSNIRGYFMWSFLDVFELMDGYESSYGLYYVDRDDPDLKRYPKLSAHWYSQFLKGRSLSSDEDFALEKNFSGPSYGHDYQ